MQHETDGGDPADQAQQSLRLRDASQRATRLATRTLGISWPDGAARARAAATGATRTRGTSRSSSDRAVRSRCDRLFLGDPTRRACRRPRRPIGSSARQQQGAVAGARQRRRGRQSLKRGEPGKSAARTRFVSARCWSRGDRARAAARDRPRGTSCPRPLAGGGGRAPWTPRGSRCRGSTRRDAAPRCDRQRARAGRGEELDPRRRPSVERGEEPRRAVVEAQIMYQPPTTPGPSK